MRFFSKISIFTPPAGAEKHPQIRSNFAHLIFSRVCHFSSLAILTLKKKVKNGPPYCILYIQ